MTVLSLTTSGVLLLMCGLVIGDVSDTATKVLTNEYDDTITIEAESNEVQSDARQAKQLFIRSPALQAYQPFLLGDLSHLGGNAIATGPCFSSKGSLGRCMSFRECYPYFKLPELGNWDTWVLGMYDTCSYFTQQGRQMFGVCCTNSQKQPSDGDADSISQLPQVTAEPGVTGEELPDDGDDQTGTEEDLNAGAGTGGKKPHYPEIMSWPPQAATHPPDHTIPPLPTHPPSPGFPGIIPTTEDPGTGEPVTPAYPAWPPKPPTHKPPIYKPPTHKPPTHKPVHPVYPTTTTTEYTPPDSGSASCGAKNGFQDQERIVGGHNADIGEWPWIAALFNGGRQFCGGSLIDDVHILSAAHCVAHMSSWDVARLTVRLGDYNIKTNSEVRHIEKKVKRVVRHRGFDSRTLYNDVAILTLDSPVTFTKQVRPICLPTGSSTYAGSTATVIGWGSLRESGPQPSVLQEVNIPIWSNNDCKGKYGPAAPGGIVEHMLCAGQANRDSCSGDSGGPLMVNNGRWTQVGVVSWGIGCGKGEYPGVYTRVEKFLPWINKNLK